MKMKFLPVAMEAATKRITAKGLTANITVAMGVAAIAVILLTTASCKQQMRLPRIGIAGIAIECSTFSPAQTTEEDFSISKGEKIFTRYDFMAEDSVLRQKANWLPAMYSRATPGGIVTRETYESLVSQTLEELKKNLPYDALYFDIHGAMSVVGLDDPEGDLIIRIREVIGNKPLISTCMDLHGNVSLRLAENTDLITCYRMAPHEDAMESKRRAVANLLERLETGKGRPAYKAWVKVPILLPGEKTSTRVEPAKGLYACVAPAAAQEGVIDAAIWIGYAWADEPRNHAVVMVTGDDKQTVESTAKELAQKFWDARHQFEFIAPTATLDECLEKALKSDKRPFMISDMGDNPTAGGAGDVTWTLARLLERKEFRSLRGPKLIYASIPGPKMVEKSLAAGVGAKVEEYIGAMVDDRYQPPVLLSGTVEFIRESDTNTEVVIKTGSMHVIVTQKRKPYHYESDFEHLGFKPRETDIIMIKVGYLPESVYNMRGDWMMALTRGGVDQNLLELPYQRIQRPMFPLDADMPDPPLEVIFIPSIK
ncbi:MAG: M81 family metallopeptidase [Bacteroidales bacterium]|jgi:microcystin degradation protein MlrC|nr:M81 family metallopeptidase [Bacteroidales bacterium]MDD2264465.1 M81 family metallopeptidase [Bacteroidales bacterium]MDD2831700.1 M81 family metallopeptidase [Bacteroidales bacterium]MDD3208927.1 M81 family metallopeptidase [Bacteroidales bacterium]MDD3697701.1 M81 family metallopeptidase [Bacteroidales bacterium]